jgi:hypothetical protein
MDKDKNKFWGEYTLLLDDIHWMIFDGKQSIQGMGKMSGNRGDISHGIKEMLLN